MLVLEVRVVVVKLVVEEMDVVAVEDNQEHLQSHGKMNQISLKTQTKIKIL